MPRPDTTIMPLIRIRLDRKYSQDMKRAFNSEIKAEKNSRIMKFFFLSWTTKICFAFDFDCLLFISSILDEMIVSIGTMCKIRVKYI